MYLPLTLFYSVLSLCFSVIGNTGNFNVESEIIHSDCDEAIEICSLKNYHFKFSDGFGHSKENLGSENASLEESNSIWLKFQIENEGHLEFLIIPDYYEDDLDFILYESSATSDRCLSKSALRTMASGKTIGLESENCIGNTGLKTGAYDNKEDKGCYGSDDNFLAPVYLSQGKEYSLLINNFNSDSGFNILFEATDDLALKNNCEAPSEVFAFELYPNPASELIFVRPMSQFDNNVKIEMIDVLGQILYSSEFEDFKEPKKLDTSTLSAGQYIVRVRTNDSIIAQSFVKK